MKTEIRNYKTNGQQFAYILDDVLTGERFDGLTDAEKVSTYINIVKDEKSDVVRRYGLQAAIRDHLQGLGANIDYWNEDIIRIGRSWGYALATAEKMDDFCLNWFKVCAFRVIQLAKYFNVNY